MKPKHVTELQQMIQNIWCGVTPMRCQKLVNSIPRRIKPWAAEPVGSLGLSLT